MEKITGWKIWLLMVHIRGLKQKNGSNPAMDGSIAPLVLSINKTVNKNKLVK